MMNKYCNEGTAHFNLDKTVLTNGPWGCVKITITLKKYFFLKDVNRKIKLHRYLVYHPCIQYDPPIFMVNFPGKEIL